MIATTWHFYNAGTSFAYRYQHLGMWWSSPARPSSARGFSFAEPEPYSALSMLRRWPDTSECQCRPSKNIEWRAAEVSKDLCVPKYRDHSNLALLLHVEVKVWNRNFP